MGIHLDSIQTPVTEWLTSQSIEFEVATFDYVEGGGTSRSSSLLGISEHHVIKTLVFKTESERPVMVLMHGDGRVDTKAVAKLLPTKKINPCSPKEAEDFSGWIVGSTSPFVLKQPMPVVACSSIFNLEAIWINGGGRGILVKIKPESLRKVPGIVEGPVAKLA